MTTRCWILGLATVAGLACGALWPRAGQGIADRPNPSSKNNSMKLSDGGGLIGASGPADEALGIALRELLSKEDSLRSLASLGAALEHLDGHGIVKLLEQVERADARAHDDRLGWLFAWWMNRNPAAASNWLRPRLDALAQDGPLGFGFELTGRAKLIAEWAKPTRRPRWTTRAPTRAPASRRRS